MPSRLLLNEQAMLIQHGSAKNAVTFLPLLAIESFAYQSEAKEEMAKQNNCHTVNGGS